MEESMKDYERELEAEGADAIAGTVEELKEILLTGQVKG